MMKPQDLVKASLFTPGERGMWSVPIILWGPPGGAKTSIIEGVADHYGLYCEVLSPGERGEGAFGVVPVPMKRGNEYVICNPRPDWVDNFVGGRGVVFVDEIPTAAPAVKPALLGLMLARRIGGTQLAPGVRVIGAGNPPELCGGYDLSAAEANRLGHIQWRGTDVEEHLEHMASDDGLPKVRTPEEHAAAVARGLAEEKRVLTEWPDAWAWARALEAAFLKAKPQAKHMMPSPDSPQLSRAWPSDRTWKMATRALASSKVHGLDDRLREQFVGAFIGDGLASEFFTFTDALDLPDARKLLEGELSFKHHEGRLDRTVAIVSAITALTVGDSALIDGFVRVLASLTGQNVPKDLVVPAIHAVAKFQPKMTSVFLKKFPDEFRAYSKLLTLEIQYTSKGANAA